MLRSLLVIAVLAVASGAAAQNATPQNLDALIDFVLRSTESPVDDDVWTWETEPGPSMLETGAELPLAGPTVGEEIGPPLAGPEAAREERERRLREAEEDAFAAPGVRLGAFVIRPSIEIGVSATSNASLEEGGPSAVGLVAAPEIIIRSEDDRYEFEADLYGEWIFYDSQEFDTRTASARASGRYDLTDRTSLVGEGGYSQYTGDLSDPDTPGGAAERPLVHEFDAMLGVEQRFGRLAVTPSALVDRTLNDDVPLSGGGVASRRELDNVEYGGRLRTGYELGAGLTPFTEAAAGRRDFDQEVDDSGYRRESLWGELRGGLVFDRGDKLSGEVSLGWRHEELEDARLPDIDALLVNASILWSPVRLTEVKVDLTTDTPTTSVPDESGSVLYSGVVTLSRRITPRIRLAGGGGVDYEYSVGGDWTDVTFTGFAEASYAFNRFASVSARYQYERLESSDPDSDYQAHTVGVRLRVQR
jgi:hypothetical protein